jgi:hypothetical protein
VKVKQPTAPSSIIKFVKQLIASPYGFPFCRSTGPTEVISTQAQIDSKATVPESESTEDKTTCLNLSDDTKQTLREMLDMELLRDPIFILFTISNIFTSIGFNVPYVYIVVSAGFAALSCRRLIEA